MIKLTRGYKLVVKVKSDDSRIVIINGENKFTSSNIEEIAGDYFIVEEETASWPAGKYDYQIMDSEGIVEDGEFIILQNFELADSNDYKSHWRGILDAVDATIAGRATNAQLSVHVGDKSLQYCTLDELLNLRKFVLEKVAEEDEEQGKEKIVNKGDQHKILYIWR